MDTRLLWFVLAGFISGTDGFVVGSLLPSISSELGITIGEAGYVAFTTAIFPAIGTPILATLFGNTERRKVLIGAELAFATGALLTVLAPTLPLLLAARAIASLGVGLFSAMALTTAVAMSPPERRARTIAVVTSGQSLAVLAGVPLGAFVVSIYNWRVIFAAVAVLALVVVLGLIWKLPRGISGDRVAIRERLGAIGLPGIPRALMATLLFMLANFTLTVFIAPLASYAGGLGAQTLPLLLFVYGAGAVAGTQLGGRVADRIGARRTTVFAAGAQVALLAALAIAGLLPTTAGVALLFVTVPLLAVAGWGFYMAQATLISSLVAGSPALALALNLTALNIGVALAARLGGAVLDQAGVFWLIGTSVAAACAALLVAGVPVGARKPLAGSRT